MRRFEYKCRDCGTAVVSQHYLDDADNGVWGHLDDGDPELREHAPCGPLKRVWSFGIAWPMAERGH